MSEGENTPKFTVVDRRKFRGDEEPATAAAPAPVAETPKSAGPRLSLVEPIQQVAVAEATETATDDDELDGPALPPAPSAEEVKFHKAAYEKAAEQIEYLVRAQNPGAPPAEKIGFEHLVQQLYLSAMMQMGAGTPEGQRPRIDILGAKQTIDLLDVVRDKTKGNLVGEEERMFDTVLTEVRKAFEELAQMALRPPMPPPPGGVKR